MLKVVFPSLRRNWVRSLLIMLQIAFGSMVATSALDVQLQQATAMRWVPPEWEDQRMSMASVSTSEPTPELVATAKTLTGMWRQMDAVEVREATGLVEHRPWEMAYILVNQQYVKWVDLKPSQGRWFRTSDWEKEAPIPVVLNLKAAQVVEKYTKGPVLGSKLGVKGQLVVVGILRTYEPVVTHVGSTFPSMTTQSEPVLLMPDWAESVLLDADLVAATQNDRDHVLWIGAIPSGMAESSKAIPLSLVLQETRRYFTLLGTSLKGISLVMIALSLCGFVGVVLSTLEQRWREFAIRAALGASTRMIIQQIAAEIMLITVGGAIPGALLSRTVLPYLPGGPIQEHWAALPLVAGGSIVVGFCLSAIPLRALRRLDPATALRDDH